MRWHPEAIILTNGTFASLVSDAGGGGAVFGDLALTRWVPDATLDTHGQWLFIRDDDTGACWSASARPIASQDVEHRASFRPGVAQLSAVRGDVEVRIDVCVAPDDDVELRRITVQNRGATAKRLELTTYAELVLNTAGGDMGHPAFSKLFVQTRYDAAHDALVAWRRLRSPDDVPLVVVQAIYGAANEERASHETDRMRFIGRGRSLASPRAMDASGALSGTVGNVLDPIFATRCRVDLGPGEARELVSVLAAARDERALQIAAKYAVRDQVDTAFEGAASRAARAAAAHGMKSRWDCVPGTTGALAYGATRLPGSLVGGLSALASESRLYALIAPVRDTAVVRRQGMGSESKLESTSAELVYDESSGKSDVLHAPERTEARSVQSGARFDTRWADDDRLLAFNEYGGFVPTGDEYVIRVDGIGAQRRLPPLPWSNVVANESVGFIASETGAGYTWSANSRENRLTPWYNDPVSDPHGEALWVRDDDTGELWSPLPGPSPDGGMYEVRHGFGYSRWTHESSGGLSQETWMFVPRHDPLKVTRVLLKNGGDSTRRLSLYSFAHLVLGGLAHETAGSVATEIDRATGALFARNSSRGEFSRCTTFATMTTTAKEADVSCTADRATFVGVRGELSAPAAASSGAALDGEVGAKRDPCAAFRASFVIAPGELVECVVLLGEARDEEAARALVRRYVAPGAVTSALDEVRAFWRELVTGIQIETPSPALDLMMNGWLSYQNLSCRMWGRSAYYQSGGAYGFRDQLQDSAALVYLDPSITRRQILLHAAHQFVEGDVLHWWHPPLSKGIRTRFSDDLLWLPFVATFYARTTGDAGVFDEPVRYLRARELKPGEDEAFVVPEDAGSNGTLYEHCCRAIDRSLTHGAHRLPLIGAGDWNDGMNRVGREGRGESVWLGFFLHDILRKFIPVCEARGDRERARRYGEYERELRAALNAEDGGWDGDWYRRAYYDNGAPLGSRTSDECKIDAIAQAWSVLSSAAPAERAHRALDSMEKHLVSESEGIIRLLAPAFDKTHNDPGYIKGYLPGVRENGGQYTHGALWAVRALAELGRSDRAARLLEMLSPISHGNSREASDRYMAEPYVIAADVYGVAPHVGRAGWTWYTGSAGWMYRVALEAILGFELEGGNVVRLRPCIPVDWPGFTLRHRLPQSATTYELRVRRSTGDGATSVVSGDTVARVANGAVRIDLVDDGCAHVVDIVLGSDVGRVYEGPEHA